MFQPASYTIAIALLPKLLGVIYFSVFGAFAFQIRGLLSSKGVLPITPYLHSIRQHYPKRWFVLAPSLFWFNSSDRCLVGVVWAGLVCSILLVCGVYPVFLLIVLYILHLSIVSVGQDFLSFGWEGFFLEIVVNTIVLSLVSPPNFIAWVSINFLLFRFHLQAGVVKLQSGDVNWRNLKGAAFHYQSQPIPNPIAWYMHRLPLKIHQLSTLVMFIIELLVPFAMFGNEEMRLGVFIAFWGLQLSFLLTGNFSYLNYLTMAFSTILVANVFFPSWVGVPEVTTEPSMALNLFCSLCGWILIVLQVMQLWQHFYPNPFFHLILSKVQPFHLVNRYGLFAVMTTKRHEVIFEGSLDGSEWKEYTFKYKPSQIDRRPPWIAPYQPRIDWQAWFLPLGGYRHDPWFGSFLYHLLKGSQEVLALIEYNPFPQEPPRYIRTLLYDYTFSSPKEKKERGWWWRRHYMGIFTRPLTLNDFESNKES